MTVSSTVRQAGPFVGDALTTVFPFGFKCFSKTDLVATLTVIASGVQTTLLVDSDFTVALNADQDATPGGSITYIPGGVAMPATNNLTITSAVPQSQTVTLTIGGGFFPTVISTALDRVVILIQELTLRFTRGLSVAIGDTVPSALPSAATRALKALWFDASGNPIASSGSGTTPVSAAMATVVASATTVAARALLPPYGFVLNNGTLVPSINAGALTIAIKTKAGADPSAADPVTVQFPNVAAATGDFVDGQITAATSITIPAAATLGTTNNIPFRFWLVMFNDGGTFRLGVVNCLSGTTIMPLRDDQLANASTPAANLAQTIYANAAVAAKAMRVVGYLEYSAGLAAAGTYGIVPTKVRNFAPGMSLPGSVVQVQRNDTGAVATGTTTVPFDDTIPQNTEGDQYLSQAITPTSAANVLLVESALHTVNSNVGTNSATVSLFQDAVANALKTAVNTLSSLFVGRTPISHLMLAATTAATTFKVRAGYPSAGTTTVNGSASARNFGGVMNSFISVTELMG